MSSECSVLRLIFSPVGNWIGYMGIHVDSHPKIISFKSFYRRDTLRHSDPIETSDTSPPAHVGNLGHRLAKSSEIRYLISIFTWHGHWLNWSLNWLTHDCSQVWSSLQSTMHWPRSILFSRLHRSRLSSFWGDLFWPQTQIGFGQPLQPSGQLVLHGQSENIILAIIYGSEFPEIDILPERQSVRARPQSLRQLVSEQAKVQSM